MPDIASPCVQICRLDSLTRRCTGCLRTAQEIARWPYADDDEKRAILARLAERRRALADATGAAAPPSRTEPG